MDTRERIIQEVKLWINRGNMEFPDYKINISEIDIRFDIESMRLNGQACYSEKYGKKWIRFNIEVAKNNLDLYLSKTVPHEVAHLFQKKIFPSSSSHGKEWKFVMNSFGISDPERCNNSYDKTKVNGKGQTFIYKCSCRTWNFTTNRHNKVKKGQKYHCPYCKGNITFLEEKSMFGGLVFA